MGLREKKFTLIEIGKEVGFKSRIQIKYMLATVAKG
jgi:hypothetical protein